MRKLIILIFISIFLFSCQKDKCATIVGEWEQIARYSKDASGQYSWIYLQEAKYPARISFTTDGKYNMVFREPIGSGKYQYNYAAKQLKIEDQLSGTISTSPVSYLDEDYLVIDKINNGELIESNKYQRK